MNPAQGLPEYEITVTPSGRGCRVLKDGQEMGGLYRLEIAADVDGPSMLILWQRAEETVVKGRFGRRRLWHDCPDCKGHDK